MYRKHSHYYEILLSRFYVVNSLTNYFLSSIDEIRNYPFKNFKYYVGKRIVDY